MLHHTHIYAAMEITGKDDPLIIYGSVLPDIGLTKLLPWPVASKKAEEFRKWLIKNEKSLSNLGYGMILHEFPCGIDRFVHNNGKGYAFQKTEHIAKLVSKHYNVPMERAKKFTHTCLEISIEHLMLKKKPELKKKFKKALKKIDIGKISKNFSTFYKTNKLKTRVSFWLFNFVLTRDYYTSLNSITKLQKIYAKYYMGKKTSFKAANEIAKMSTKHVEKSYEKFLANVIKQCKKDVKKYVK